MGLTPPHSGCSSVFPKILDILDVAEPSQTREFPHGTHTVLWEELVPAALAALSLPTTAPKAPAGSENPQFSHLDHPAQPRKTGILWDGSFQNIPQPPWAKVLNPAGTKYPKYPQKRFPWSEKHSQRHIRSGAAAAPGLLHTNPKIQERLRSAQEFPTSASASGTARERKPSSRVNPRAKSLPESLEKSGSRGVWEEERPLTCFLLAMACCTHSSSIRRWLLWDCSSQRDRPRRSAGISAKKKTPKKGENHKDEDGGSCARISLRVCVPHLGWLRGCCCPTAGFFPLFLGF